MTYSHMGNPTLPSALRGFTSEFGKGSGGSLLLLSPAQLFMLTRYGLLSEQCSSCLAFVKSCTCSKQCFELRSLTGIFELHSLTSLITKSSCFSQYRINCRFIQQLFGCCIVKPHEQLVLVSFMHHCTSTSNLSTS